MKHNSPDKRTRRAGARALWAVTIAVFGLVAPGSAREPGDGPKTPAASGISNALASATISAETVASALVVSRLAAINVTNGPVTAAQAAEWRQRLKRLTEKGAAAVPAIRDFLAKNVDLNFEPAGNEALLGAASLRLALLGVVEKIGGPEAVALSAQTLQTTADPAELATLIRFLDRVETGKHRVGALVAARETLALAASGRWDGREVAPLFEILKKYGGAWAAGELEKYANTWFDYTPIALAQLPDAAGVPTLIRLAKNADGRLTLGHDVYQRVLAQVAVANTNAAEALVEQTRQNRIEVNAWPAVGAVLAGNSLHLAKPLLDPPSPLAAQPDTRRYHVAVGHQNFIETTPHDSLAPADIGVRIRLVDRLLEATTNPAAIDALEGARISLAARLPAVK
ncbi:MAG: hypothetical protein EXS35_16170 [Pedosphaera sp.]|nr:hypothetical protein [Pedosphaera sp.]